MWGQSWGDLIWGTASTTAQVPFGGWALLTLGFLIGVLAARARRSKAHALVLVAGIAVLPAIALTATSTLPHAFQNGTLADADEVNANFTELENRISGVSSRFGESGIWPWKAGRGTECTLGAVMLSAGTYGNGMEALGQLLPIASNTALYTLLGTRYGGDGRVTFALPDLRDATPRSSNGNNLRYFICTQGVFPSAL